MLFFYLCLSQADEMLCSAAMGLVIWLYSLDLLMGKPVLPWLIHYQPPLHWCILIFTLKLEIMESLKYEIETTKNNKIFFQHI